MEKKLKDIIKDCERMMDECGFELPEIEFKLNGRLSRTLGQCTKLGDNDYMIEISKKYAQGCIETGNIKRLEQTILHEMAHTLPFGHSHGKAWKIYASIINDKFGYEITRLVDVPNEIRQYWIKDGVRVCCDECNNDVLLKKNSKVVQNVVQYKCSCGGKLKLREVV